MSLKIQNLTIHLRKMKKREEMGVVLLLGCYVKESMNPKKGNLDQTQGWMVL